jgi:hypothetical protein
LSTLLTILWLPGISESFASTRKDLEGGLKDAFKSLIPEWNLYLLAKEELYLALTRRSQAKVAEAAGRNILNLINF